MMKKIGSIIGGALLLALTTMSGAEALTINLIQNGDFEAGGGSLAGWAQSGNVQLYTAPSGDHEAALGWQVNGGDSLISQAFTINSNYFSQRLAFDYIFNFQDINNIAAQIDVFAAIVNGNEQVHLASFYTPLNKAVVTQGHIDSLLIPQLNAGTYALMFRLTEATGSDTNSFVKLDNIALTTKVPEPGTLLLLGSGLLGMAAFGRRRFNK